MDAREIFLDELKKLGAAGLVLAGMRAALPVAKTIGTQVGAGVGVEAVNRATAPKGVTPGASR